LIIFHFLAPFVSLCLNCGVVLSSFFLEKNEVKKASPLSKRFAFKGVRGDKDTLVRD